MRTIAMDFWASLEDKIHDKYGGEVAGQLDVRMEQLHAEVHGNDVDGPVDNGIDDLPVSRFWALAHPAPTSGGSRDAWRGDLRRVAGRRFIATLQQIGFAGLWGVEIISEVHRQRPVQEALVDA